MSQTEIWLTADKEQTWLIEKMKVKINKDGQMKNTEMLT